MKPLKRLTVTFLSFLILTVSAGSASAVGDGPHACFTCMDIELACTHENLEATCDLQCNGRAPQGCWEIEEGICDPETEQHIKCQDLEL